MDFDDKRKNMVATQLITRGIVDNLVLDAMLKIPRHLFVSDDMIERAYYDMALDIGVGQTISQPYMVAVMTELLELDSTLKVLEIGTGSGYQTAILAEIVSEVYTIERIESHTVRARQNLNNMGYSNVYFKSADGSLGWPNEAPFDRILVTAAAPDIPPPLIEQLADNGIALAPVGQRHSQQLQKLKKSAGSITTEYHVPCLFVPLIGKHGWQE
ncbi:MAG: protein-L-isoaspartate(D-aspartate) O-methyltransferase [Nitrospirae bacterium]|nr:protein-L-isoaspartate(D-aspartate) O-methyltransferase [Nitrospirota bacterium]